MMYCDVCGAIIFNLVYHTGDMKHKFCGAECSLAFHMELKEKENGE